MRKYTKPAPAIFLVFSFAALLIVAFPALAPALRLPTVPSLPAPPNARIIYLINTPHTPLNAFTSSARLNQQLGAQITSTWQEVVEADQTAPIDALVIDASALSSVDKDWVANAYRRGTVIAGFSITGSQMAGLVDNTCIASDNFANYADGAFFVVVSSSITGSPEDIQRIFDSYSRSCETAGTEGVSGTTSAGFRRTTERLDSENTFNIFAQTLNSHLN